jgi:hypothetical protein
MDYCTRLHIKLSLINSNLSENHWWLKTYKGWFSPEMHKSRTKFDSYTFTQRWCSQVLCLNVTNFPSQLQRVVAFWVGFQNQSHFRQIYIQLIAQILAFLFAFSQLD